MNPRNYLSGMRPPTLALSLAPVWMGTAAAWHAEGMRAASTVPAHAIIVALLCLGVAMFLQIAANFANDYSDGIRGTDTHRSANERAQSRQSAQSAPSGVLANISEHDLADLDLDSGNVYTREELRTIPEHSAPPRLVASGVAPNHVLAAAIVNAALACACGIAVMSLTGHWWLVIVGAVCLAAAWFYVGGPKPYGYMGFGELAAFVFFGLAATLGTQYALCGTVTGYGWYGASVIGAVAAAVLAVNNLRDVRADSLAGKHTLAVRMGARASTVCVCVLLGIVVLAMVIPWSMLWMHMDSALPNLSLLGGYCAALGMLVLLLLGVATEFNIAKQEYRSAMRHLAWIALAVALVYSGMASSL